MPAIAMTSLSYTSAVGRRAAAMSRRVTSFARWGTKSPARAAPHVPASIM